MRNHTRFGRGDALSSNCQVELTSPAEQLIVSGYRGLSESDRTRIGTILSAATAKLSTDERLQLVGDPKHLEVSLLSGNSLRGLFKEGYGLQPDEDLLWRYNNTARRIIKSFNTPSRQLFVQLGELSVFGPDKPYVPGRRFVLGELSGDDVEQLEANRQAYLNGLFDPELSKNHDLSYEHHLTFLKTDCPEVANKALHILNSSRLTGMWVTLGKAAPRMVSLGHALSRSA